jgi:hypothetical protein
VVPKSIPNTFGIQQIFQNEIQTAIKQRRCHSVMYS